MIMGPLMNANKREYYFEYACRDNHVQIPYLQNAHYKQAYVFLHLRVFAFISGLK